MDYPCKIGKADLPRDVAECFEAEEHEYLIAVGGGDTFAANSAAVDYWDAFASILGYVDLTSGSKSNVKASARWVLAIRERQNDEYRNFFEQGVIYRVKALPPKLPADSARNTPQRMAGVYVREILEKGAENEFLQPLIDKFNEPVSISSKVFGEMALDKQLGWYEGKADWLGERISFYISCEDEKEAKKTLKKLEKMYSRAQKWDKEFRGCAAKELTELANDWLMDSVDDDCEQPPEITEADFASRIKIESIELDEDGEFTVFFGDDDMFFGHSAVVYGNLKNGAQQAQMEG